MVLQLATVNENARSALMPPADKGGRLEVPQSNPAEGRITPLPVARYGLPNCRAETALFCCRMRACTARRISSA
jgi:hypothetical protein